MVFDFDLTGVEVFSGSSKLIPAGTYLLQIDDTEEKKSSNGNQMVVVNASVANGGQNGKKIKHYVTFSDKTKGMVKHFLKCIEEPHEGKITPDPISWIGKMFSAEIVIVPNTFQGKTFDQNKIKNVYPSEIPF